ncbi:hypothetical protein G6F70_006909 [Rhizopus microsporus]|uniref:Very long-chain fatty acid transport protein n=1 Tax=Rhizopus microsporus TaxID=58291 RepID=A0A1X0RLU0_RHIZD|nr:hypothetical protein G6F71_008699 [Rhizopus microsporus]KAG1197089.1 hypothetical protein G6F70_006909 [Rhizopus microsporus]KAG1208481.1 hypothetical protein G6F69_007187 [Rhizopus microsporus]ORE12992.1 acetyl-CoA synthetase-like protein [Rhizopus microsporus]
MSPDVIPVVAAGLGGLFGTMYLDSRYLLSRDFHQLKAGLLANLSIRLWELQDKTHYYFRFKEKAKANPDKLFVMFEGKGYTFRHIEKASNRLAHWLIAQGTKKGDIVCMMLQNHPTFYISLLAISKIGAIPSLINTNLVDDSLLHCLRIASTRLLLFDPVYEKQVATILDACRELNVNLIAYGESTEENELPSLPFASTLTPSVLASYSDADTSEEPLKGVKPSDAAYLIYTSGTTGMPKAAISQHSRIGFGLVMYANVTGIQEGDRVYCVLPLYHSSGMIVASSVALYAGATIILGRKFSARRFWNDCVDYKVDVFTYIGEFCRYLLSQPPHPEERNHKVKMVYGNGMRPDVWRRFQERFNIPKVCEFYAATEAPTTLFNVNTGELGAGAVGSRGIVFRTIRSEVQLIKIDPITEEPVRDKNGFCVKSNYDEQGELVVRMDEGSHVTFGGYYKNKGATQKKILRNVFKKGDAYFRSGDLLKMDKDGFYYFGDRVGDTFRWKSENVATTEVAQVIGVYPGIAEANVYGVTVPNHDGRAGMAALVLKEGVSLDFKDLYQYLRQKLPKYAIPVFIRFVPSMDLTGTFKQQKVQFRNQGIDLTQIPESEPVYWLKEDTYVPFTLDDYAKIDVGKVKL